jgi:hypothetical protein
MVADDFPFHHNLKNTELKDISTFYKLIAFILIFFTFLLGIFPSLVFGWV